MKYDAKITPQRRAIIARYGAAGYAAFWYLLSLYEEQGTAIDRATRVLCAVCLNVPLSTIDAVCFDFGVFRVEGGNCYPLESDTDAESARKRTAKAKAAAAARWEERNKAKAKRERRRAKAEEQPQTQPVEQDSTFAAFAGWLQANCPYLSKPSNIQQITPEEFDKLKAQFDSKAISETLLQMENRKDKRKQYANYTARC